MKKHQVVVQVPLLTREQATTFVRSACQMNAPLVGLLPSSVTLTQYVPGQEVTALRKLRKAISCYKNPMTPEQVLVVIDRQINKLVVQQGGRL